MTIADFYDGTPFRLSPMGKAVYYYTRPCNLWPKRKDGLYINHALITKRGLIASRWHGHAYQVAKLLPLLTPAYACE